jgi:hypothetical protein
MIPARRNAPNMPPITPPTIAGGVPVEDEEVLWSYGNVLEDAGALCAESVPLETAVTDEAFVAYVR